MPWIPKSTKAENTKLGPAFSLGTNFSAGMLACAGLGFWIDKKRGGGTAFTLVGLFLGLLYGAYEVYKVVKILEDQDADES